VSNVPLDIISLFPAFDSNVFGGVQFSGRDAWNGILGRVGDLRAHAFCYQAGASKARAVANAIGNRRKARVALVWHLHLLKLLPLLDHSVSRVVLFLHGIEAWRRHDPLTQLLLKRVDLFLSNSDHTWTRFIACNPSLAIAPHQTVHLGLGSPLHGDAPSAADCSSVVMVGRLDAREDYKGHRQVIAAWPHVIDRTPDARLHIVGDGGLRPILEDLARRNGTQHSIQFHGQASDRQKEQLLAQCRCLVMPSRGEGFGLVYLEAMRIGRPCLVSHADAGREVVNPPEAGLAVDPDDPRELAEAIHRLLTPGAEWDEWSARARARYEARFTAAHFQNRLLAALFDS
jgi:phosphatidylinositol alpha-1,6-mannosyltransferase